MNCLPTALPGVIVIEPKVHGDARGFFFEAFQRQRFAEAGLPTEFPQANVSRSAHGVLRGLHYQWPKPQGKLVYVLEGEVWDVAVDIRPGSPHRGRWFGTELSADNHRMMYVPPGYAHGFVVLSEYATFSYLCTELYDPSCDRALAWDDPECAVAWPLTNPELSPRDRTAPQLCAIDPQLLPEY